MLAQPANANSEATVIALRIVISYAGSHDHEQNREGLKDMIGHGNTGQTE
jgi:hypothetical protein